MPDTLRAPAHPRQREGASTDATGAIRIHGPRFELRRELLPRDTSAGDGTEVLCTLVQHGRALSVQRAGSEANLRVCGVTVIDQSPLAVGDQLTVEEVLYLVTDLGDARGLRPIGIQACRGEDSATAGVDDPHEAEDATPARQRLSKPARIALLAALGLAIGVATGAMLLWLDRAEDEALDPFAIAQDESATPAEPPVQVLDVQLVAPDPGEVTIEDAEDEDAVAAQDLVIVVPEDVAHPGTMDREDTPPESSLVEQEPAPETRPQQPSGDRGRLTARDIERIDALWSETSRDIAKFGTRGIDPLTERVDELDALAAKAPRKCADTGLCQTTFKLSWMAAAATNWGSLRSTGLTHQRGANEALLRDRGLSRNDPAAASRHAQLAALAAAYDLYALQKLDSDLLDDVIATCTQGESSGWEDIVSPAGGDIDGNVKALRVNCMTIDNNLAVLMPDRAGKALAGGNS